MPYAEDQLLGRELIEAGLAKVFPPRGAVLHSHHHRPLSFMPLLRRVPRAARSPWTRRSRGSFARACARAASHERRPGLARVTRCSRPRSPAGGPAIAAAPRSPASPVRSSVRGRTAYPAVRRRLSYEGRSTFDPIDVPRSVLLDDPVRWPRKRVESKRRALGISSPRLQAAGRRVSPVVITDGRRAVDDRMGRTALGCGFGGHMTIFRLVRELELLGHSCAVFVFDPFGMESRRHAAT